MKAVQIKGREEEMLTQLQEIRDEDATTIVRQALRTEFLLQSSVSNGETIFVKTKQGVMRQVMFSHMES